MPKGIKDKVAILGMGCSQFGERWDAEADDLMVEAYLEALADAGIETKQIDAARLATAIEDQHVGKSAVPLARALVAGGLPVIEVTLRTSAALAAVRAIAAEVPDCVVGVGTVTRVPDIEAAIVAGARYLVSPGTPDELAAYVGA